MSDNNEKKNILNKEVDRRSFVVGGLATALAGIVTGGTLLSDSKVANAATQPTWDGDSVLPVELLPAPPLMKD